MAQFHPLTLEYQSNQLLGQVHVCKQPNHQRVLSALQSPSIHMKLNAQNWYAAHTTHRFPMLVF